VTRPVTSLGHQGWRRVFWEGPKFFKLCPIVCNCAQQNFPWRAKSFAGRFPLVTGLIVTFGLKKLYIYIIRGWFLGRRKRLLSRASLLRLSHCFGKKLINQSRGTPNKLWSKSYACQNKTKFMCECAKRGASTSLMCRQRII